MIQSTRMPVLCCVLSMFFVNSFAEVYTLDELINEAVKNSIALRSVKKEIEQEESKIQELYAGLFPQVSASVDVSHTFAYYLPFEVNLPGNGSAGAAALPTDYFAKTLGTEGNAGTAAMSGLSGPLSENLITVPANNASASLLLRQPIFMQGKTISRFKIVRARQRMLLCNYEQARDRVKGKAFKLFYRMLLEQKRLEIGKEYLALAKEGHRLSLLRFSQGRGRELDTLNSLLELEQARIDNKRAESDRRTAGESLITHCGIAEQPADFWVDGTFPEPVFLISVEESIEQLHRGNHRIIQLKGEEIIQNEQVRLAKAEYLPQIFAGATFGRIGRFSELERLDDISWGDDQKIFVSLTWNLFSGLSRRHVVQQRIAGRELSHLAQRRTIDSLELATRSLYERTKMDLEQLTAWKTVVAIARKSHAVAEAAYSVGSGTSYELRNTRLELNKKMLSYNEALCAFHVSVTDFKMLIGLIR